MKLRDLFHYFYSGMQIIIQDENIHTGEPFNLYKGEVQDTPYWLAEYEVTSHESIEIEDGKLLISVAKSASVINALRKKLEETKS